MAGPTGIEPATYGLREGLVPLDPYQLCSPTTGVYGNVYVCNAVSSNAVVGNFCSADFDWEKFRVWLLHRGLSRGHVTDCVNYARRYGHVLFDGDVSGLAGCGRHVLCALSNLSKYLGKYGEWRRLLEDSGLHWKQSVSAEDAFLRIYSGQENVEHVEVWVNEVRKSLEWDYLFPVLVSGLTGMRVVEAVAFLNKVAVEGVDAYPQSKMGSVTVLEHFKVRDANGKCPFLRGCKNLYISVVGERLLECLRNWKTLTTYNRLRMKLRRVGVKVEMKKLRKFYGSLLREKHVEAEAVDLLCGRISQSVFTRSYLRYDVKRLVRTVKKIMEPYEKEWLGGEVS